MLYAAYRFARWIVLRDHPESEISVAEPPEGIVRTYIVRVQGTEVDIKKYEDIVRESTPALREEGDQGSSFLSALRRFLPALEWNKWRGWTVKMLPLAWSSEREFFAWLQMEYVQPGGRL